MTNTLAFAENARKRGKYKTAKVLYQKTLELEPENEIALEGLIESLYGLGDKKRAQEVCNRVIEINPTNLFPHIFLAYIYDDLDDKKKSRDEAKIALSLSPNSPEALCCYGIILTMNKEYRDAIKYLKSSIAVDPKMYLAHYNLLVCYSNIQDYNNAYIQAKTLYKLKPNIRNVLLLVQSYLAINTLLRVLIYLMPVILFLIGYEVFLAIHALLILIFISSAVKSYKNGDVQQLRIQLIVIALFIFVDVMLFL